MNTITKYQENLAENERLRKSIAHSENLLKTSNNIDKTLTKYDIQLDKQELTNLLAFSNQAIIDAASANNLEDVKFLFNRVSADAQYKAFHAATNKQHIAIVIFFLEQRLNAFKKIKDDSQNKVSAYQIAKIFKHTDIIKLFESGKQK